MYEDFFGFRQRPFASVPAVDQYFPAVAIEAARQTLVRCIERGEGAGLVIGPSGTGKTLLCRLLARHFRPAGAVVTLCSGRISSRRALFQAILYELGRPYRGMDEGELRLTLIDYLTVASDGPAMLLLLVDEAQTLPLRLLDEIRMLGNLVRGGKPLVRLVLAGSPALEERLASPKLESFSQRLAARCYLVPFERGETEQYVSTRIATASKKESTALSGKDLFAAEACKAIHRATDGVPRLINQVCDHALLLAYAGGKRQIDAAGIEEAWADLQQLPTPNSDEAEATEARSIIEFGGLDDEPEVTPSSTRAKDTGRRGEEASRPLRVAALESELSEEPERQIDDIEETLAELEEDFRPAGSIGPEVEVSFEAVEDPFGEQFEEEEVVADRFVAAGTVCPTAEPALPEPPPDERVESGEVRDEFQDLSTNLCCSTEAGVSADAEIASGADLQSTEAILASAYAPEYLINSSQADVQPEAEPETVPLRSQPSPESIERTEAGMQDDQASDVIVVEDDYDDSPPSATPSAAKTHRGEYRRLFAKLRSG